MVKHKLVEGIRYNECVVCGIYFRGRYKSSGNFYKKTCSPECEKEQRKKSSRWPDERKKRMSELLKGRDTSGWNIPKRDQRPNWKGGCTPRVFRDIAFNEYNLDRVCSICGSKIDICVHHKDENRSNNNIENLQILCKPCHASHHSKNNALWIKHLNGKQQEVKDRVRYQL